MQNKIISKKFYILDESLVQFQLNALLLSLVSRVSGWHFRIVKQRSLIYKHESNVTSHKLLILRIIFHKLYKSVLNTVNISLNLGTNKRKSTQIKKYNEIKFKV